MYQVGDYIIVTSTKEIKVISEIERYDDDIVFYTTDGMAHGIRDCRTVHSAYNDEVNKLLKKWKI
jgi:hypothetical protein